MLREQFFDTGEVRINYAEGPVSGPPLVLAHGIPGRWQELLPILPALVLRWHCYAIDLRGHGRSGRVAGKYLPAHYTADVVSFLRDRLHEAAVLFGMSAGGVGSLAAAAQVPEKVRAVIIGDSPIDMDALTAWMSTSAFAVYFQELQELAGSHYSIPELARALGNLPVMGSDADAPVRHRDLPGMDAAALRGWAGTIHCLDPEVLAYHATGRGKQFTADLDMQTILQQIHCPVLLLQADPEQGALLTDAAVEDALSLLPDGVHVKLGNAGHNLGLDTWEVAPLLRAVVDFLESL